MAIGDLFTCARCRRTFAQQLTDEACQSEAKALFGEDFYETTENVATVCDDCFEWFMKVRAARMGSQN